MQRVELGQGGLFHCQKCGGVWLNPLHLKEIQRSPNARDYVTFPQAGAPPIKPQGTRVCPHDGQTLELSRSKGVTVDECPVCQSWYLDPGELGTLL
jgi:Zn-finger nucleic acid-binding protein